MPQRRLDDIRAALLKLHKTLVESERVHYEKVIGKIKSPGHFLQLLTTDPWFAWLHPLSELIVSIDEATDGKEPLTALIVDALARQAGQLLVPAETGEGFGRHYFDALQNDPDVVFAHAETTRVIGRDKPATR